MNYTDNMQVAGGQFYEKINKKYIHTYLDSSSVTLERILVVRVRRAYLY